MNLKAYDILSMLIPGFVVLMAVLNFLGLEYNSDFIFGYTAVAVVVGYLVNTLSSWMEDVYFWSWGGKPSSNLLQGNDIAKVRFHESAKAKRLLVAEGGGDGTNYDHLFEIAMRYSNSRKESRVRDFNANYAFSRAVLTTTLAGTILLLIQHYAEWKYYAVLLPVLFVTWLRCKQRGYFYAREVLIDYLSCKESGTK